VLYVEVDRDSMALFTNEPPFHGPPRR